MIEWLPYLTGLSIAVAAGALGPFVVWRRMAYFGDSLAHSALLGIALGITFHLATTPVVIATSIVFALMLVWLQSQRYFASDTLLGIMAHSGLSIGMVTLSVLDHDDGHGHSSFDIHHYFFGNLEQITQNSVAWIGMVGIAIAIIMWRVWQPMVLMTLHSDLARAEGVRTTRLQLIFMIMMALFVAVSIQLVGVLLITAMLIIPAAAARPWVSTPHIMTLVATIVSLVSIVAGLQIHILAETPSGPTIVTCATVIFIASLLLCRGRCGQR